MVCSIRASAKTPHTGLGPHYSCSLRPKSPVGGSHLKPNSLWKSKYYGDAPKIQNPQLVSDPKYLEKRLGAARPAETPHTHTHTLIRALGKSEPS